MRALAAIAGMVALIVTYYIFADAITSPELTARYEAREATRQVQAQEWNATVRGTVPWLAGGLAAVAVVGVGGWTVVEWQRNRTQRAATYEDYTTRRHLISAQRDVVLAYIAMQRQHGEPDALRYVLDGVTGVLLPSSGEFVPWQICQQELQSSRLLTVDT